MTAVAVLAAACGPEGTPVAELAIGDCVEGPTTPDVATMPLVECASPHDAEVVHTAMLPGEARPADDELTALAQEVCLPAFEDYVGSEYATSELEVVPVVPTAEGWAAGDRGLTCLARAKAGGPLETTVRDSGR